MIEHYFDTKILFPKQKKEQTTSNPMFFGELRSKLEGIQGDK